MLKLLFVISVLVTIGAEAKKIYECPEFIKVPTELKLCQGNSDCTSVFTNGCCKQAAVNAKKIKDYNIYQNKIFESCGPRAMCDCNPAKVKVEGVSGSCAIMSL